MGLGAAAAAGISAVGSIAGGIINSGASQAAAQEQYNAQMAALQQQQNMFNTGNNALSPFYTAGANNIGNLQTSLGNLSALTNPGTASSALQTLPGFQFQSQWGNIQAKNALAAEGLGGSAGPLATAISQYNQGLAGTYYQNAVNNQLGTVNALQNFTNTGANAASSLLGAAVNSGNAQATTLGNAGNALASGTLGSANAISGGLTGASGSASNALVLSSLLGNNNGGLFSGSGGFQPASEALGSLNGGG